MHLRPFSKYFLAFDCQSFHYLSTWLNSFQASLMATYRLLYRMRILHSISRIFLISCFDFSELNSR